MEIKHPDRFNHCVYCRGDDKISKTISPQNYEDCKKGTYPSLCDECWYRLMFYPVTKGSYGARNTI